MSKARRWLKGGILAALITAILGCFVACDNIEEPPKPVDDPPTVTIEIGELPATIAKGQTVALTATVTGADDTTYKWSVSDPDVIMITDNTLSVLKEPTHYDVNVSITATAVADERATASKSIRVIAHKQEGQNGLITAEMIEEIGDDSITISGTITDHYIDQNSSFNSYQNVYNSTVKMADGKWSGTWEAVGASGGKITNIYLRGEQDGIKDENGQIGHALLTEYIDKDNKVTTKPITNYVSIPAIWESQHYWNHLGGVPIDKLTYDPDELTRYIYTVESSNTGIPTESEYLMAYLAFSCTPILESDDAFERIILVVDKDANKITKLIGESAKHYVNPETDNAGNVTGYDAMSYTTVELSFSDIGTTEVSELTPYTAVENADKLTAALSKMHTATSYSFVLTDNMTSPDLDDSDYTTETQSVTGGVFASAVTRVVPNIDPVNNTSGSGTVGLRGWIDENAAVFARTTKYDYTMDNKPYKTEYTGYRQYDGYYEEFSYDSNVKNSEGTKVGGLKGTKRVDGNFIEVAMPKFEFSSALFSCNTSLQNNKTVYVFTLKETAVTRDIAMQLSNYVYATDAGASSTSRLRITCDGDGNLLSCSFPYEFAGGSYYGVCSIVFDNIDNIELNVDDIFDVYEERGLWTSWDKYAVKYYRDEEGNEPYRLDDKGNKMYDVVTPASVGIQSIYGANASGMPTPGDIQAVLGDNLYGPFYDERNKTLPDGTTKKIRYMSFTAESMNYDENMQITDFDELVEKFDAKFKALGFSKSALTDITGGKSGRGDRYLVYDNGKITVVIENNFTKNFWIYFYNSGDYTRS